MKVNSNGASLILQIKKDILKEERIKNNVKANSTYIKNRHMNKIINQVRIIRNIGDVVDFYIKLGDNTIMAYFRTFEHISKFN